MTDTTRGILAMVAASMIWGFSGIYYKMLANVPSAEILGHRTLWSAVFFGLVVAVQGRLGLVRRAILDRRVIRVLVVAAFMVGTNWFLFIVSIQTGHALQASMGYYIFPLVLVALGVLVYRERFSRWQVVAIGMAAAAVMVLTAGLGALPWVSLVLAGTFGVYSLLKKRIELGPVVSVFIETLVLAPIALVWLWGVHLKGWGGSGGWFGSDLRTTLLLICSGPITAGPLILTSFAARRIGLSTLGLIQYLNPTLQFLVAVFLFGEAWTVWHATAFALIWTGLAIYSVDGLRQERLRSRSIRASTLS